MTNQHELKNLVRTAMVAIGSCIGTFAMLVVAAVILRPAAMIPHAGAVLFPLVISLPFVVPWLLVNRLKARMNLNVPHPENAVGGMALGFALVMWISMALLMQSEYVKPPKFGFGALALTFISMSAGALLALRFLRKDYSVVLLLVSPVLAAGSFFALAYFQPDRETQVVTPIAAPIAEARAQGPRRRIIREGPLRGRREKINSETTK